MADRRFPARIAGEFETHLTVRCPGAAVGELAEWARGHGAGTTHIVLGRGRTVSQPMLTLRAHTTLAEARTAADRLAAAARAAGYDVVRTKIEAAPWHPGVPATASEALALGPDHYFEHHAKLLLDPGFDARALIRRVVPHGAHVSRNARRARDDGRHERFVTQRCHGVGNTTAAAAFARLLSQLRRNGYQVVSAEREFVVHDDSAALDHGWLDQREDT